MVEGSCLCGGVAYQLVRRGHFINNCHCSRCRKATGGAFSSNLHISKDHFQWLKGEELLRTFRKTENLIISFCEICGSRLPSVLDHLNHVVVPAGTLDDDPDLRPIVNIYVGSKAPWYQISDGLPAYEENAEDEFWARHSKE